MKLHILSKPVAAFSCAALLAAAPLHADNSSDSTAILKDFGWFMSQQVNQLDLSKEEQAAFLAGIKAGLDGQPGPDDQQATVARVQGFLQQRLMAQQLQLAAEQGQQNEAFFAQIANNPKVVKSDSGLYYEIIEQGDAKRAGPQDSVKVHYEGSLTDGTVFDSSKQRGQPVTFPVDRVVPGFGEGVRLVGPGGKVRLYIPPQLGYGETPPPGSRIPPNAVLVFDVDMIEVNPEN